MLSPLVQYAGYEASQLNSVSQFLPVPAPAIKKKKKKRNDNFHPLRPQEANRIIMFEVTSAKLCELPADEGTMSPSLLTTDHADAPCNMFIGARWREGTQS